jgi:dipeptidyl aminopeptidase/acylaminoacyl peptidase
MSPQNRPLLSALFLGAWVAAVSAAPPLTRIPIDVFFGNPEISQLRFSPDGRYLGALVPVAHRMNLVVMDLENKKQQLVTKLTDEGIQSFQWANNDRLLFVRDEGGKEQRGLYAVSRQGGVVDRLAYNGDQAGTARINQNFGDLIRRIKTDPNKYFVAVYEKFRDRPDVGIMDVRSGAISVVTPNPGMVTSWVLDRKNVVRVGIAQDDAKITILYRDKEGAAWETIATFTEGEPNWMPLAFDGDNRTLFVSSDVGRATRAIYKYDTVTRTIGGVVAEDSTYDIDAGLVWSEALQANVGVRYEAEREKTIYWNNEFSKRQAIIDRSLPGYSNVQIEASDDGTRILVYSRSDQEPGVYFVYDEKQKRLEQLAVVKPKVDPDLMAKMKPITYTARDGLQIHGYLTLPNGLEPKNLPLVVNPHGGPYGPRDTWGFRSEVQFLASRGFAVLQMNFRGSGGYGRAFEQAGYKKWGLEMQDDITDGVRWAISEGVADPKRVVIEGASYGGYAAMAGVAFTPELYCAAVNYVGVTDLVSQWRKFIDAPREGKRWVDTRIGDLGDHTVMERLEKTSPSRFADRIRVPVLMAYGRNDPRVNIEQGYAMEAALKRAGIPHKMIIKENEGHGFRDEGKSIGWYQEIEAFLDVHVPGINKGSVKMEPFKVIEMPAKSD